MECKDVPGYEGLYQANILGEIKFFPSAKAAATAANVSHAAIKNRCRGAYVGEYASDGYKYEYDE